MCFYYSMFLKHIHLCGSRSGTIFSDQMQIRITFQTNNQIFPKKTTYYFWLKLRNIILKLFYIFKMSPRHALFLHFWGFLQEGFTRERVLILKRGTSGVEKRWEKGKPNTCFIICGCLQSNSAWTRDLVLALIYFEKARAWPIKLFIKPIRILFLRRSWSLGRMNSHSN
jgi:hypothetical protein